MDLMDKFHWSRLDSEFTAALEVSQSFNYISQYAEQKSFAHVNSHVKLSTVSLWVRQFGSWSAPNLVLSLRAAAGPLFPSWPPAVTAAKPNRGSRGRVGPQVRSPFHPANNFLAGPCKWGRYSCRWAVLGAVITSDYRLWGLRMSFETLGEVCE